MRVSSERGSIEAIRVRVTAIVRAGELFIPFHWNESCANRVTDDEFDPISREPNFPALRQPSTIVTSCRSGAQMRKRSVASIAASSSLPRRGHSPPPHPAGGRNRS